MKFGFRKPSLKKSFKARTTGKMKRKVKSSVNPFYGKKGTGYIRNPKRAVYNKAYNKTTVGVNPLASIATTSKKHTKQRRQRTKNPSPHDIGYTRHKTIEREVPTNSLERFIRKILKKKNTDTKTIQEKVVVEQYTYSEMLDIEEHSNQRLKDYNQAIKVAEKTSNQETFFPRLIEAEEALKDTVKYFRKYNFLTAEGDDLEEAFHKFLNNKTKIVASFVDKHFKECVESSEELKTERGRTNRYIRNYKDLKYYFEDLPKESVDYIQSTWQEKVAEDVIYG